MKETLSRPVGSELVGHGPQVFLLDVSSTIAADVIKRCDLVSVVVSVCVILATTYFNFINLLKLLKKSLTIFSRYITYNSFNLSIYDKVFVSSSNRKKYYSFMWEILKAIHLWKKHLKLK